MSSKDNSYILLLPKIINKGKYDQEFKRGQKDNVKDVQNKTLYTTTNNVELGNKELGNKVSEGLLETPSTLSTNTSENDRSPQHITENPIEEQVKHNLGLLKKGLRRQYKNLNDKKIVDEVTPEELANDPNLVDIVTEVANTQTLPLVPNQTGTIYKPSSNKGTQSISITGTTATTDNKPILQTILLPPVPPDTSTNKPPSEVTHVATQNTPVSSNTMPQNATEIAASVAAALQNTSTPDSSKSQLSTDDNELAIQKQSNTEADTEADTKTDTEADTKTDTEADTKTDTKTDTKADAEEITHVLVDDKASSIDLMAAAVAAAVAATMQEQSETKDIEEAKAESGVKENIASSIATEDSKSKLDIPVVEENNKASINLIAKKAVDAAVKAAMQKQNKLEPLVVKDDKTLSTDLIAAAVAAAVAAIQKQSKTEEIKDAKSEEEEAKPEEIIPILVDDKASSIDSISAQVAASVAATIKEQNKTEDAKEELSVVKEDAKSEEEEEPPVVAEDKKTSADLIAAAVAAAIKEQSKTEDATTVINAEKAKPEEVTLVLADDKTSSINSIAAAVAAAVGAAMENQIKKDTEKKIKEANTLTDTPPLDVKKDTESIAAAVAASVAAAAIQNKATEVTTAVGEDKHASIAAAVAPAVAEAMAETKKDTSEKEGTSTRILSDDAKDNILINDPTYGTTILTPNGLVYYTDKSNPNVIYEYEQSLENRKNPIRTVSLENDDNNIRVNIHSDDNTIDKTDIVKQENFKNFYPKTIAHFKFANNEPTPSGFFNEFKNSSISAIKSLSTKSK